MTTQDKKIATATWILRLTDDRKIDELYKTLQAEAHITKDTNLSKYGTSWVKVKDTKFDFQTLAANSSGSFTSEELDAIAEQLDIQESVEELLLDLKAMG